MVRLTSNEANLELFKISLISFWLAEPIWPNLNVKFNIPEIIFSTVPPPSVHVIVPPLTAARRWLSSLTSVTCSMTSPRCRVTSLLGLSVASVHVMWSSSWRVRRGVCSTSCYLCYLVVMEIVITIFNLWPYLQCILFVVFELK